MAWITTRSQAGFREELDEVFPERDRRSDGTVGNLAHQGTKSGHNPDLTGNAEHRDGDAKDEVRARDVDKDLVPGSGIDWMERVVQYVVRRARAGHFVPFRYIIYKGRIWSSTDGWQTRVYTGANGHYEHAHFSGAYSQTADEWTGRLGLASLRPVVIEEEEDVTFGIIELPLEYAYRSTGAGQAEVIDKEAELTFPTEPFGYGNWADKALWLSLAGDRPNPEGDEIVRVAIYDGTGWTVAFHEIATKTRVKVAVPAAKNDNALIISFGRVARAGLDLEAEDLRIPSVNACFSVTSK